ncbi:MAG: hypothetical protein QW735_02230 [archaeon]
MTSIGAAIDKFFDKIADFVTFFICYTIVVFILGEFYGIWFGMANSEFVWYPIYLLFIVLLYKVLKDYSKQSGKSKK